MPLQEPHTAQRDDQFQEIVIDEFHFATWFTSRTECMIYTDNDSLSRELRTIYRPATYERDGKIIAWQFLVPAGRLKFYLRLFEVIVRQKPDIELQRLTRCLTTKFDLRHREKHRAHSFDLPPAVENGFLKNGIERGTRGPLAVEINNAGDLVSEVEIRKESD